MSDDGCAILIFMGCGFVTGSMLGCEYGHAKGVQHAVSSTVILTENEIPRQTFEPHVTGDVAVLRDEGGVIYVKEIRDD